MAALGDTGRFTVPRMAAARAAKQAASAAAAAAAAVGSGFEIVPSLDVASHVTTTVPAADVNAVAKQFAYATASARNNFAVRAAVAHVRDTARACRLAYAIGHGRRERHLDFASRATSRSRAHQRKWRSRTHTSFSVFVSNNPNTNKKK